MSENALFSHVQAGNPLLEEAYWALEMANRYPHPETCAICLDEFWDAMDRYYAHISSFSGFTCQKGCSACCFDNPHGVSGIELARIHPLLTPIQKDAIRLASTRFDSIEATSPEEKQIHWKQECHPCPLLTKGTCSVYSVRPLACRSFFSRHAPDWCHPKHSQYQPQPQIGNDDIHALLVKLSLRFIGTGSTDLLSGLATLVEKK